MIAYCRRQRFKCATATIGVLLVFPVGLLRAQQSTPQGTATPPLVPNAYQSTYKPLPSRTTLIRNATILTAAGPAIERGSILLQNGKIAAIGQTVSAPADALVIDATGKWVTPGVIDTHSHLGVYAAPGIESLSGRQRDDQPEHRGSVRRALALATGSAVRSGACRRRHDDADPAGIGEPLWRTRRHGQERAVANGGGDEVSGRTVRFEDGVRRESEARLRLAQQRAADPDGQRRRLPPRLAAGGRVSRQLAALEDGGLRSGEASGRGICSSRPSPVCSTARSSCTTTAIAPTRWRR